MTGVALQLDFQLNEILYQEMLYLKEYLWLLKIRF